MSLAGNKLPAKESLVSDIPAGDGKKITFFKSVAIFPESGGSVAKVVFVGGFIMVNMMVMQARVTVVKRW